MRVLQTILSEAFHKDIALRMFPPEKVKARVLWAYGKGRHSELSIATGQYSANPHQQFQLVPDIFFEGVYKAISNADPTPQKKYAPWVMRMWVQSEKPAKTIRDQRDARRRITFPTPRDWGYGVLFLEDLGRVNRCLTKFDEWKRTGLLQRLRKILPPYFEQLRSSMHLTDLPGDALQKVKRRMQRLEAFAQNNFDINSFSNWHEFEDTISYIDQIVDNDPEVQASRRQKQQAEEERMVQAGQVRMLFNDDVWKVVELLSKEASMVYGKNTRWCTAGDEMNAFNDYVPRGRLFVIINKPKNERWQFWASLAATPERFEEMLSHRVFDWMQRNNMTFKPGTNPELEAIYQKEMNDPGNVSDMLEEFIEECVQFMDERDDLGWQVHIPNSIWDVLRSQVPYAVDMFRKWQRDD